MVHSYSGRYVVLDGLDGIGKGTGIRALVEFEKSLGRRVFDVDEYQKVNNQDPKPDEFMGFDALVCSEPTYALDGKIIREVIISRQNRGKYTAGETARAYAADRYRALNSYVLPALDMGKTVLQSRSVSTSIVYQPVQAQLAGEDMGLDYVLGLGGNRFALRNSPNLLIVPTIENVDECISRLKSRQKDDDAIFESLQFQLEFKPRYESAWFQGIFRDNESRVVYVDAGVSPEFTSSETVRVFKEFFGF